MQVQSRCDRYCYYPMKVQTDIAAEHKTLYLSTHTNRYTKGRQLGKGGFAKCYEVADLHTGRAMAAKVVEKAGLTRTKAKEKLVSEIQIHKSIRHEYVVSFESSFEDAECVYIIMELCPNQTLNELLRRRKRLTELEAQSYLFQLATALDYLHKNRIIHRDLKLSNLFLSDKMEIKVGDLGLAAKLASNYERRKTICGTPNYIAPEILDGKGHSYEVDLWSYGVIAYALMVGRLPFESKENNVNVTYNRIRMCNYSFPEEVSLTKSAKNFISKLLQLDPLKRMTLDQILSHDFLTSNPIPKTLPLSTLAQPPSSYFAKQFCPPSTNTLQREDSTKEFLGSRRNSSTERVQYLQTRMSAVDIIGKISRETVTQDAKIPRPASTAVLSKWKYLEKKEELPLLELKRIPNEIEQWVCNHIESSKYGTCYSLNSGAIGMFFIDSTCLIADACYTKIKYMSFLKQDESHKPVVFEPGAFQPSLAKKMKILEHFKLELYKQKQLAQRKMTSEQLIKSAKQKFRRETKQNAMNIFVKKCGSKNGFKYFLFSNNVFQGIFKDGSEILISPANNLYINRYGEQKVFLGAEDLSEDVAKKYLYLQGMLKSYRPSRSITKAKENDSTNINKSQSLIKKETSYSTNDSNSLGVKRPALTCMTDRTRR